jgi:hypothetical protein
MRVLRSAGRGALLGALLGLLLLVLDKLAVATVLPSALAWLLTAAGLIAGAVAALVRPAIRPGSAALFLDHRCGTEERFVTLWALPASRHASEWARELAVVRAVPRLPIPREAGLLPAALFLLFGAGLLPEAVAERASVDTGAATAKAEASAGIPAASEPRRGDPERAAETLRKPGPLAEAERERIERAIDAAFVRPEDRAAARAEFARARAGDAAARVRLGKALVAGPGALQEATDPAEPPRAVDPPTGNAESGRDAAATSPYPEETRFLRAYEVELARLRKQAGGEKR